MPLLFVLLGCLIERTTVDDIVYSAVRFLLPLHCMGRGCPSEPAGVAGRFSALGNSFTLLHITPNLFQNIAY